MANIERIKQALSSAESNLKLATQLLNDLEGGKRLDETQKKVVLPGTIGTYDGESMVTESGEKHPVPANYASKSMLVVGDTLKLVDEKGGKRFKQIEHVKRLKTEGVLSKKDGKFHVLAREGSYRVLPAAVDHFGVGLDDKLNIWIPASNQTAYWAAIESVVGKEKPSQEKTEEKPSVSAPSPVKKTEEKKPVEKEKTVVPETPKPKSKEIETKSKTDKVEETDRAKAKVASPSKPKEKVVKPVSKVETVKTEPKKPTPKIKTTKVALKKEVDDEELA